MLRTLVASPVDAGRLLTFVPYGVAAAAVAFLAGVIWWTNRDADRAAVAAETGATAAGAPPPRGPQLVD